MKAWVWGDFIATLQKNPMLMSQGIEAMLGKPVTKAPAMTYPYTMVFYNKAKNPHGPSSRPVLCVGLEQADYSALAALMGSNAPVSPQVKQGGKGPIMVGVFYGSGRTNRGNFDGFVTAESARECFFNVIRSQLGLIGEPVRIGAIRDIYGHPDTGWPADTESPKVSRKSGCSGMIASLAALVILIWGTSQLVSLLLRRERLFRHPTSTTWCPSGANAVCCISLITTAVPRAEFGPVKDTLHPTHRNKQTPAASRTGGLFGFARIPVGGDLVCAGRE